MSKVEFNIYEDLEKVNANSLLIESGTEVASLQVDNIYLSLMCYGEINVYYGDDVYKRPCEYPKIITDYLLGKVKEKELKKDFWVADNNWFQAEIFVVTDKKEYKLESIELINGYEDTFDIEGDLSHYENSLSEQLYKILLGHLKDLKRDYQDRVEELEKLNLENL